MRCVQLKHLLQYYYSSDSYWTRGKREAPEYSEETLERLVREVRESVMTDAWYLYTSYLHNIYTISTLFNLVYDPLFVLASGLCTVHPALFNVARLSVRT